MDSSGAPFRSAGDGLPDGGPGLSQREGVHGLAGGQRGDPPLCTILSAACLQTGL